MEHLPEVNAEILTHFFRENRPELAASSIRTYVHAVLRVVKALGREFQMEELDKWLESKSPAQARNTLTPFLMWRRASPMDTHYRSLFDKYNASAESAKLGRTTSKREADNWVTVKAIRGAIRRMGHDSKILGRQSGANYRLFLAHFIFRVHDELHLRNDLPTVRIVNAPGEMDEKHKHNYYVRSQKRFYWYHFKTRRSFMRAKDWPVAHTISPSLARFISKYIRQKPESPWLICDPEGHPLSKSAFSAVMTGASKRYLGVRLGSTMLRRIYLSEFEKTGPSLRQRKAKLRRMLQTKIETQLGYVRPDAVETWEFKNSEA